MMFRGYTVNMQFSINREIRPVEKNTSWPKPMELGCSPRASARSSGEVRPAVGVQLGLGRRQASHSGAGSWRGKEGRINEAVNEGSRMRRLPPLKENRGEAEGPGAATSRMQGTAAGLVEGGVTSGGGAGPCEAGEV